MRNNIPRGAERMEAKNWGSLRSEEEHLAGNKRKSTGVKIPSWHVADSRSISRPTWCLHHHKNIFGTSWVLKELSSPTGCPSTSFLSPLHGITGLTGQHCQKGCSPPEHPLDDLPMKRANRLGLYSGVGQLLAHWIIRTRQFSFRRLLKMGHLPC